MREIRLALRSKLPGNSFIALVATSVAVCGLALETESRLERDRKAFEGREYRAAMIDAKSVLRAEPSNIGARILHAVRAHQICRMAGCTDSNRKAAETLLPTL